MEQLSCTRDINGEQIFLIWDNTGHEDWFCESQFVDMIQAYLKGPAGWIKLHNAETHETIYIRGTGEVELANDD